MTRRTAWLVALSIGGCGLPRHDTVMQGNANGVVINFAGDLAETEPLARQYCARYERVPVFRQKKDENAYYDCVPPGAVPHVTS